MNKYNYILIQGFVQITKYIIKKLNTCIFTVHFYIKRYMYYINYTTIYSKELNSFEFTYRSIGNQWDASI